VDWDLVICDHFGRLHCCIICEFVPQVKRTPFLTLDSLAGVLDLGANNGELELLRLGVPVVEDASFAQNELAFEPVWLLLDPKMLLRGVGKYGERCPGLDLADEDPLRQDERTGVIDCSDVAVCL
jgi:hypothetical protein